MKNNQAYSGKKLHIFFGDDDREDVEFFTQAIEEVSPGIKITIARDGAELLEFLQLVIPDIIFLDLNMPVMNGVECLQRIRSNKKCNDVPVIIYSTSANPDQIEKTYELGANMYIQKPTRYDVIKNRIRQTLALNPNDLIPQPHRDKYVVKLSTD